MGLKFILKASIALCYRLKLYLFKIELILLPRSLLIQTSIVIFKHFDQLCHSFRFSLRQLQQTSILTAHILQLNLFLFELMITILVHLLDLFPLSCLFIQSALNILHVIFFSNQSRIHIFDVLNLIIEFLPQDWHGLLELYDLLVFFLFHFEQIHAYLLSISTVSLERVW